MNLVFLHTVADVLRRHPKRVMGSLGALLLGTGVTAFGVAPLAPDAADLPVRSVSEAIEPALRLVQGSGEVAIPFVLFRSDTTRRDDNAQSLLQRLGVSDSAAAAFLRSDPRAREPRHPSQAPHSRQSAGGWPRAASQAGIRTASRSP